MFKRIIFNDVLKRIIEPRKFIQVLAGPRQVGKTTLSRQLMDEVSFRLITLRLMNLRLKVAVSWNNNGKRHGIK